MLFVLPCTQTFFFIVLRLFPPVSRHQQGRLFSGLKIPKYGIDNRRPPTAKMGHSIIIATRPEGERHSVRDHDDDHRSGVLLKNRANLRQKSACLSGSTRRTLVSASGRFGFLSACFLMVVVAVLFLFIKNYQVHSISRTGASSSSSWWSFSSPSPSSSSSPCLRRVLSPFSLVFFYTSCSSRLLLLMALRNS